MPGEGHYPIWAGRCWRAAGGWGRGSLLHTRGSGVDPETQGVPGPARQPPSAPPGHVRASPCVRARRAGGGQSGAAAHLVPGEPLAPASPQTRGPDTQTLIDRRAQPRAARARRRPASRSECGVGAARRVGRGRMRGRGAQRPPSPSSSCLVSALQLGHLPSHPRSRVSTRTRVAARTALSHPGKSSSWKANPS